MFGIIGGFWNVYTGQYQLLTTWSTSVGLFADFVHGINVKNITITYLDISVFQCKLQVQFLYNEYHYDSCIIITEYYELLSSKLIDMVRNVECLKQNFK